MTAHVTLALLLVSILLGWCQVDRIFTRETQCSSLKLERWCLAMASLKKISLRPESLDFWRKGWEVEMSTERAKICNHKTCEQMKFVLISKNLGTISNICYKIIKAKFFDSISVLRGWFSTWKTLSLTWNSGLWGRGNDLCACSLLLGPSDASFSLKKKVLT